MAILLSGPIGAMVTLPEGSFRTVSMMKSTACCSCRGVCGGGRSGPSSPVSVNMLRRHQPAHKRARKPCKYRHVLTAGQIAYLAGVHLGQIQRYVPGDGGDAEKIDFRARQCRLMATCIILPRVGINDQWLSFRHGGPLLSRP